MAELTCRPGLQLQVALEEGFSNDDVTVRVDGEPVFEGRAIQSRLQIGLAQQAVVVEGTTYAGVSIGQGGVKVRISSEPFRLCLTSLLMRRRFTV